MSAFRIFGKGPGVPAEILFTKIGFPTMRSATFAPDRLPLQPFWAYEEDFDDFEEEDFSFEEEVEDFEDDFEEEDFEDLEDFEDFEDDFEFDFEDDDFDEEEEF